MLHVLLDAWIIIGAFCYCPKFCWDSGSLRSASFTGIGPRGMVMKELNESSIEYAWRFEATLLGAHRC